jgi:hypothetical protein
MNSLELLDQIHSINSLELLDQIHSGPAALVLDKPLRFSPRSSPLCDFNEFLQALQSSETIRNVTCKSQQTLGITENEWVLLVKTIGRIADIQILQFYCTHGTRDFHPFQAVADAVNNARSLRNLAVDLLDGENSREESSGLAALANALREHPSLQEFRWFDINYLCEVATVELCPDLVLVALPACPHLRVVIITTPCASAGAMKKLLQLPKAKHLALILQNVEHWLAVTDEIRQGRCNVQRLHLSMLQRTISDATEAVKVLASAIQLDRNLTHLHLAMERGFTDEAGVALAEALTANKTLRWVTLDIIKLPPGRQVQDEAALGAVAYDAFSAMLRVNTSLRLDVPSFDDAGVDERLVDSRSQMRIELRLNQVGRGRLLSSSQKPRKKWVNALNKVNSSNVDESPEFNVSCLYSLLRLNPATCM